MTQLHAPTLREAPKEAELVSHRLLLRAGFIRQLTAGIYDILPLGMRSVTRISNIIREELNRAGAQEVLLPAVQPAELWKESGRWEKYGPELLRFRDRKEAEYCLGPTHEEVIVDLVRRDVRSYRQLPVNLYQIQFKFRDEIRPRGGLMRGREFIMKDAYSFDASEEGAHATYRAMYQAYEAIFRRCGLDFRAVEADTGNIGGSLSHEFQVLAAHGEDAIVSCDTCSYTANVEKAAIGQRGVTAPPVTEGAPERVATPNRRTIDEVSHYLSVPPDQLMKTLVVLVDGQPWAALVRGDRELNPLKIKDALGASEVALADDATVTRVTGAPIGFIGPIGLPIPIIADPEIMLMVDGVCGANELDAHLVHVAAGRDFTPQKVADIHLAIEGDACPRCHGHLRAFRGIEVGHVFYLGTRYSVPMSCTFLDRDGQEKPMIMGCYGIGVTRILAAAVEQHFDDRGIIWPMALAPFQVDIIPLGRPGDDLAAAAEQLYRDARAAGIDAVLDDRDERPGVKFADADLMGFPLQLVLGKRGLADGKVELKFRDGRPTESVPLEGAVARVQAIVREALQ